MFQSPFVTCHKVFCCTLIAVLSVGLCFGSIKAGAADITVNSFVDVIDNDDGLCTLREAITAANTDTASGVVAGECPAGVGADTINLATGTYTLAIAGAKEDNNLSGDLDILSNITISGAGIDATVIDAARLDRVMHVFTGAEVTVEQLTLTNGVAPDGRSAYRDATGSHPSIPGELGGGLYNSGTFTMVICKITNNRAGNGGNGAVDAYEDGADGGHGGGCYNDGTLTIAGSMVTDNSAGHGGRGDKPGDGGYGGHGGGLFSSGLLTIENSIIGANQSGNGGFGWGTSGVEGGNGGGIDNSGSLDISNSTLSGNRTGNGGVSMYYGGSGGNGGGIYNGNSLILLNSTIGDNWTGDGGGTTYDYGGSGGNGGGIYNGNSLILLNSTIGDNWTGDGGGTGNDYGGSGGNGGGIDNSGTLDISNSTLSGNRTGNGGFSDKESGNGGNGGGISTGNSLTLLNSTISGNRTGRGSDARSIKAGNGGNGGGMYMSAGLLVIELGTVTNNSTGEGGDDPDPETDGDDGIGGGIYRSSGTSQLKNTIIVANDAVNNTVRDDCSGYQMSLGYNLVGNGTGCPDNGTTDQTTSESVLRPLADNGGDTATHALVLSSPAMDVIPFAVNGCGTDYTDDQRGLARPYHQDGSCDVGAYEAVFAVWDGEAYPDNDWSTALNWSNDIVPGSNHVVYFKGTGITDSMVDNDFTVFEVLIDAEYTGEIHQNGGNNLTVQGRWSQTGGTFTGGSGVLAVNSRFDLSAGNFTAPSGLMRVGGGFQHSGGIFLPNDGRMILDNTDNQQITAAASFHDLIINDGLVGYWKLDEGSGAIAGDSSGYGNNGALVNSPAWTTDTPGIIKYHDSHALELDNDTLNYVTIDGVADQISDAVTIALWVKAESDRSVSQQILVAVNTVTKGNVVVLGIRSDDTYQVLDGGDNAWEGDTG